MVFLWKDPNFVHQNLYSMNVEQEEHLLLGDEVNIVLGLIVFYFDCCFIVICAVHAQILRVFNLIVYFRI